MENKVKRTMEKHLDFTIDMETTAMTANAAVMMVAIVPWLRDNDTDPFCNENELQPYVGYVDLRTCVVDGFDFDPATIKWWSERSKAAKEAVTEGLPEHIADVLVTMLDYIRDTVAAYQLDSICLWSHGADFDIAILRSLCKRYDIDIEDTVPHTSFRDCRTVILETALACCSWCGDDIATSPQDILRNPGKAYDIYQPLPDRYANGAAHDALYDGIRSSWYTWQALKAMRK